MFGDTQQLIGEIQKHKMLVIKVVRLVPEQTVEPQQVPNGTLVQQNPAPVQQNPAPVSHETPAQELTGSGEQVQTVVAMTQAADVQQHQATPVTVPEQVTPLPEGWAA